ncbi:DUF1016 N-terminal domain-containing protein [Mucilaginibacter sp.]|uniref:DUF1016 N-terminal domain-containing protein n=1 Tax=Mucilaginibacter sp. TaxID=1882438 RepID=UPI002ED50BB1
MKGNLSEMGALGKVLLLIFSNCIASSLEIHRADYGNYLTKFIADQLEPEYGSGFSKRQIELFRQFYRTFPIANALRSQLSWSQYKVIIRLDSQDKRDFYIMETMKSTPIGTLNL